MSKSIDDTRKISPLYSYWGSNQNDQDEAIRINKASDSNQLNQGKELFIEEPYKWEILFQSTIKDLLENKNNSEDTIGNFQSHENESIKALNILLKMLSIPERNSTIQRLAKYKVVTSKVIEQFNYNMSYQGNYKRPPKERNTKRFLKILYNIFTNPFHIEVKRKKRYLYEFTGGVMNSLRKVWR